MIKEIDPVLEKSRLALLAAILQNKTESDKSEYVLHLEELLDIYNDGNLHRCTCCNQIDHKDTMQFLRQVELYACEHCYEKIKYDVIKF